jgi:ubiquinone/menaquinone biosynthesis C-methylase UbiE
MSVLQKIQHSFSPVKNQTARVAYNTWAKDYDNQPDNLMLALDEEIFTSLLNDIDVQNKIVADIGCGTGRHWKKLLEKNPKKLIGFDVSEEMLKMLQQKFPFYDTHLLKNDELPQLKNNSCDLIISTLTIAHIKNAEQAITEWNRVLSSGGYIIITDFHPVALSKGGKRTFRYNNKTIAVTNYVHSIEMLRSIAGQLHLSVLRLEEKVIDETSKPYYEKQNALDVFEKWKGVPIIYGMCLKKRNAAL